jgi:uncharacterized phage protein (TIGR01671 family)
MTRPIKFRAWDKEDKEMYAFDLYEALIDGVDSYSEEWPVMQYTGLKDRHGKEIYEGDIVHVREKDFMGEEYGYDQKVEMANGCWRPTMMFIVGNQVEIIGNIYSNPELLK